MLRIDRKRHLLQPIQTVSLSTAGMKERADLQFLIRRNPEAFFKEMGEDLILLGEEVCPSDFVDNRIDLLAVDKEGTIVILELKRGSDRLQLLQALSYAAMMAEWESTRLFETAAKMLGTRTSDVEEQVEAFLESDLASVNQRQRIVLLAEQFEFEVLATAQWLTEKYELDVRCYQVNLAADGDLQYLSCACIYPAPELRDLVVRRTRRTGKSSRWTDWQEVMAFTDNQAVAKFYGCQLEAERPNHLPYRRLSFYADGVRRWNVFLRRLNAYVAQKGRFDDDINYWKRLLGDQLKIEAKGRRGRALKFYLTTEADFNKFLVAVDGELQQKPFSNLNGATDDEEDEVEVIG